MVLTRRCDEFWRPHSLFIYISSWVRVSYVTIIFFYATDYSLAREKNRSPENLNEDLSRFSVTVDEVFLHFVSGTFPYPHRGNKNPVLRPIVIKLVVASIVAEILFDCHLFNILPICVWGVGKERVNLDNHFPPSEMLIGRRLNKLQAKMTLAEMGAPHQS